MSGACTSKAPDSADRAASSARPGAPARTTKSAEASPTITAQRDRCATELEIVAADGRLEVTVPDLEVHVELDGGLPVLSTDREITPLSANDVRAAVERVRR